MSLSKLFNFKYLLQNIKKSKMAIILFFIIVPIFTSLMIIAVEDNVFDFLELASINMGFMYVIPFIFSFCLFGYVFKKNSVDFMGSMPISRKCIFITNTIGGIALIVLLQLITFVLSLVLGALTECTIFAGMAFDILIYQTIAYIFMFTIANLAMSVSGNVLTQIVVTILITFLIPFSTWYISESNSNDNYHIEDFGSSVFTVSKMHNYTAPFLIADDGNYAFNKISICKMLVLIAIYFTLGLIAFNRRKMEIAGESFDNKYVHFIVKGLTLAPFVVILIELGDSTDFSVVAIILAIIAVYYFIYDLITAKRMKFRENLVGLVFSIIALYGAYSIWAGIDDNLNKRFKIDDIKRIEIERNEEFKFTITDKDKIRSIVALAGNNAGTDYYNGSGKVRVYIEVTRYGGSKYYKKVYVPKDKLSDILEDSFADISISKNAVIDGNFVKFTDEEEEFIKNRLNETLKGMNYRELLNVSEGESNIYMYEYRGHELARLGYPISIDGELANVVMNAYNRYAREYLNTGYHVYYYNVDFFGNVSDEVANKMDLALNHVDSSKITDFIFKNYKIEGKDVSKCAMIYASDFRFYIEDIDAFLKILNEAYEENKQMIDSEFEEYYSPKYKDIDYSVDVPIAESTEVIEIID